MHCSSCTVPLLCKWKHQRLCQKKRLMAVLTPAGRHSRGFGMGARRHTGMHLLQLDKHVTGCNFSHTRTEHHLHGSLVVCPPPSPVSCHGRLRQQHHATITNRTRRCMCQKQGNSRRSSPVQPHLTGFSSSTIPSRPRRRRGTRGQADAALPIRESEAMTSLVIPCLKQSGPRPKRTPPQPPPPPGAKPDRITHGTYVVTCTYTHDDRQRGTETGLDHLGRVCVCVLCMLPTPILTRRFP